MGITDKAKDKLQDAAGGVRGARGEEADGEEAPRPSERFEPEEVRRRKKPKENLPQPEDFRPQS